MPAPVIYFDLGNTLVFGPTGDKQPFDDAVATIEALWLRGYQIGLLSNQAPDMTLADMPAKLTDYGLEAFRFDVTTISSEFSPPIPKPAPQIFQAALAKAGYSSAGPDTVFVTETLSHIQAARALGWRGIHIPFGTGCTAASGECVEALDDLLDLFPPLDVDVYLRDNLADDGDEPSAGAFWNSPDLWIRNSNDNGTSHENPIAGQDNWFHARIHNRGVGIARNALVWHKVQEWLGTQFVYSGDYFPPTALIGVSVPPGDSAIARVRWPMADVPSAGTHACWTSAVILNGDPIPNPSHVWEANNLGQKNLTILEMAAGETTELAVVIGSRAMRAAQAVTLELWQPTIGPRLGAQLRTEAPRMLNTAVARIDEIRAATPVATGPQPTTELLFLDPARLELRNMGAEGGEAAVLQLAAGSSLDIAPIKPARPSAKAKQRPAAPLTARLVQDAKTGPLVQFADAKSSAIALGLRPSETLKTRLSLTVPKDAEPGRPITVDLIQRAADGTILGGISVEVRVAKSRRKKARTSKPAKSVRRTKS